MSGSNSITDIPGIKVGHWTDLSAATGCTVVLCPSGAIGGPVAQGNVGVGAGATCGKLLGPHFAMKGGLGSASRQIEGGVIVAGLVAVNAVGDVYDPHTGRIVAGARNPAGRGFAMEA